MKKQLCIFLLPLLIISCASPGPTLDEQFQVHLDNGHCDTALDFAKINYSGCAFYHRFGAIELDCRNNPNRAKDIWIAAAEHGCTSSSTALLEMGMEPPTVNAPPLPPVPPIES